MLKGQARRPRVGTSPLTKLLLRLLAVSALTLLMIAATVALAVGAATLWRSGLLRSAVGAPESRVLGEGAINQPALLAWFDFPGAGPDNWDNVKYRPRAFGLDAVIPDPDRGEQVVEDPGPYEGWDILYTPNEGYMRIQNQPGWLLLRLNRPATLAVVWRGGVEVPAWLGRWTPDDPVTVNGLDLPTYRLTVPAGDTDMPAVYDASETPPQYVGRDTYWVLLAEADGSPTAPPLLPRGASMPVANQPCPEWVHDQYVATGPDGAIAPTWHPRLDPVYRCDLLH